MAHSLPKSLRAQLETTVKAARDVAETAARAVLTQLGVGEAHVPDYLSDEQKALRRRLRAHGRSLGDAKHGDDAQELRHLVGEVAYEHWHRMLFARFLAENGLLLWEPGAPVSLDDCRDMVAHHSDLTMGAKSHWELAGKLAARMLPQVFKPRSPVFELRFAPEHQRDLEKLLAALPTEVFQASDSLGWVYQFWQAKRKDEVNLSEVKIGADELPAVTQLFTEPYMVEFLLHNSLGAWWHTRHPDKPCPVKLTYLRFLPSPSGRGVGGEGVCLPSPSGRGVGGEGATPTDITDHQPVTGRAKKFHDIPAEHIAFARGLRKNQTDAENLIWSLVRGRRLADCKFRRQYPIGPYALDFYCHEKKLALELDGGQHNDSIAKQKDIKRTDYLAQQGIRVLRFWNHDVLQQTESVLEAIWNALHDDEVLTGDESALTPGPSPGGRGGLDALTPTPLPEGEGLIPAAGKFEGWPDSLAQFKLLDPCCGSGHFLVAAFLMLVPMRMAAEGLTAQQAVDAVLRDNLHGLEIDPRCVEIAVFALALAAWRYPDEAGNPLGVRAEMPAPNIACCGLKVAAKPQDWEALVPNDLPHAPLLRQELRLLHATFRQAPLLGSLLDPSRSLKNDLATSSFETLKGLLEAALSNEQPGTVFGRTEDMNEEAWDHALSARGLLEAARLLDGRYHLVITNVPYLARGKQSDALKQYCETHYPAAKNDLANVFLERCLELTHPQGAGVVQIVMPQNWLFLTSYKKQRESLLKRVKWNLLARLGEGGFDSPQAAGAFIILLTQTHAPAREGFELRGVDASAPKSAVEKAELLREGAIVGVGQRGQLNNPDARIALSNVAADGLLSGFADSFLGLGTGDFERFGRVFWEFSGSSPTGWSRLQCSLETAGTYEGLSHLVAWNFGEMRVRGMDSLQRDRIHNQDQSGQQAWSKPGVAISLIRELKASLFSGERYDKSLAVLLPKKREYLPAIWAFCSSPDFNKSVRQIEHSVIVANGTLVKVPFDLAYWQQIATERYPNGLPKPYSDDPTQWIFHGHPLPCALTPNPSPGGRGGSDCLQVAVARLLGYTWPAENALTPNPSPGGRGEQEMELSPGGRGEQEMELADEARQWIARCQLLAAHTDDDGIVCLPAVRGEKPAHERLLALLIDAWETVEPGSWKTATLDKLLTEADCAGKGLEVWLREKFFEQHARRFHHRPFIWHVWDGLKDGFGALVNYHQLDARKLERLIHTYLGDWIRLQEAGVSSGIDGAPQRLAAAQVLKKKLEAILEGEAPYDIFVRWKPLQAQPIGWNPDLNDGVRLNIRPFMTAEVLRHNKPPKLNIKWDKDRGKDVESAPWYQVFRGERINDHHLTRAEKRAARG